MNKELKEWSSQFLDNRHALMAFIYGLVRDAGVAEDIFQEVWVRLAETAEQGTPIHDLPRWSRGVAKNLLLHHWREKRTAKVIVDSQLVDLAEQAFAEHDTRSEYWGSRRKALRDCVQSLPKNSRQIMELKYDRGFAVAAIARQMSKTVGSVMMTLSRVRKGLAQCADEKLKLADSTYE